MRKKFYSLSADLYLAMVMLVAFSSASEVAAQAACSSNGDLNSAWTQYFNGTFYWDGSVPASFNSTIQAGMITWNNAPYRSPTFYVTTDVANAQGVVKFVAGERCGLAFEVAACTNNTVQASPRKWETRFNSHTCYVSSAEGSVAGCYNVGHVMGHEYGHVMALTDNYNRDSGADDSITGNIYYSDQAATGVIAGGGINDRRCGDNNGLNRRYSL